jgi:hypothetical protein
MFVRFAVRRMPQEATGFSALIQLAASFGLSGWLAIYYREIDRQRFELFERLHKEFRTTKDFNKIFNAIDSSDNVDRFLKVDSQDAHGFAAFFEIVAISVQSNLMSPEIANYFFGNYLLTALKSKTFQSKIGYTDPRFKNYWSLLRTFELKLEEERKNMNRDNFASELRI